MRQEEPSLGGPLGPLEALHKILRFEAAATSDWLGCVGLGAARYPETPAFEFNRHALIHHTLALFSRPPEELASISTVQAPPNTNQGMSACTIKRI